MFVFFLHYTNNILILLLILSLRLIILQAGSVSEITVIYKFV